MLALQITAMFFIALAAALFFVPQIVAYGPRAVPALMSRPEVRFIATSFASLVVLAAIAPSFAEAVAIGGSTIYATAIELTNMNFGVV
ncbi:MAG: hypothetical protein AAGH90_01000 [Pseudomonadota bacterium]